MQFWCQGLPNFIQTTAKLLRLVVLAAVIELFPTRTSPSSVITVTCTCYLLLNKNAIHTGLVLLRLLYSFQVTAEAICVFNANLPWP